MKVDELMQAARDAATVRRVYGDPVVEGGVTVIPAARVAGGAGGGTGNDRQGQQGEGGGWGVQARPAGAYVIKDGKVSWRPAVDVNRLLAVAGVLTGLVLVLRQRSVAATRKR